MSTRIITFADGFSSASAPADAGISRENYLILNNTTAGALFTIDQSLSKSMFADYELRRNTSLGVFIQTGSFTLVYDGAWSISYGNFSGSDMIQDTIVNTEHIKLMLNTATGALTYDSGNMSGTGYTGTFKLNATRTSV